MLDDGKALKTKGMTMAKVSVAVQAFAVAAGLAAAGPVSAQTPPPPPTTDGCAAEGQVRYICGQAGPEDLVQVPGTRWVLVSSYAKAGIKIIDSRSRTSRTLFPAAEAGTRFDARTYAGCPGPLSPGDLAALNTHGLALQRRRAGGYTLYATHHGEREAVEVFVLNVAGKVPRVTWVGCVVAPMPLGLNSVVALPGGGFITSNFRQRGPGAAEARALMAAGKVNGELWEWQPGRELVKVPGSEASGANGVELSRDGKWLFMAGWGSQTIERIRLGVTPVQRESAHVGFKIDNLRLGADGQIYGAGQPEDGGVRVIRVNPGTLRVTPLLSIGKTDHFGFATAAIPVGREVWVGSAYGDRIGIFTPKP